MRLFLLFLTVFTTALFTSCDNDEKYFNDNELQKPMVKASRTVGDPNHPIIDADLITGNWIDLYYIHPSRYMGSWNIYLQYKSGAEWKYYNPNGNNTPYIMLSGTALHSYIISFGGQYLPKGNPVIRICVDEYGPNGLGSTWSEPYTFKSYNQYGFTPAPNFDGFGTRTIEVSGTLRPTLSNAHSAKVLLKISGNFESSPITKLYNIGWISGGYYFSTKLGTESDQSYKLSYTVTYYDYTGKELFPTDNGSRSIDPGSSGLSYLNIFN